jgi:hypothetical protein
LRSDRPHQLRTDPRARRIAVKFPAGGPGRER